MSDGLLPDKENAGRPFPTHTRLGRVMRFRGYEEVYILAGEVKISPRQLTEYLAGREEISTEHLVRLAKELDVDNPMLLQEPKWTKG